MNKIRAAFDEQHVHQPVPLELAPDLVVGYTYENGLYKAKEFEYLNSIMPAGSMSATTTDIAKLRLILY